MASWETLVAFATVTILVAYFPGPALLYTAAQTIPGGDKQRASYDRAVTDVLFDCRRAQVGFLPSTTYYLRDSLVAAIKDETLDESQVQFVRFAPGSPQMKALQAACGK